MWDGECIPDWKQGGSWFDLLHPNLEEVMGARPWPHRASSEQITEVWLSIMLLPAQASKHSRIHPLAPVPPTCFFLELTASRGRISSTLQAK